MKIIPEVFEPYNNVLYNDCMYTVLLTVLKLYQESDMRFLVNEFPTFMRNSCINEFYLDKASIKVRSEVSILNELGFRLDTYSGNDYISYVKECINDNKLVLVCIDQYYYENVKYNNHSVHDEHDVYYLLIYGYADTTGLFEIMSLQHDVCVRTFISYTDFTEGVNGYRKRFSDIVPEFAFVAIDRSVKTIGMFEPHVVYTTSLHKNFDMLISNLRFFDDAIEHYHHFDFGIFNTIEANDYTHPITHMILAKNVQVYRDTALYNDSILAELLMKSLNNLRVIIAIFLKIQIMYKVRKQGSADIVQSLLEKLCTQKDAERAYLERIYFLTKQKAANRSSL